MRQADVNGDGSLSKGEVVKQMQVATELDEDSAQMSEGDPEGI